MSYGVEQRYGTIPLPSFAFIASTLSRPFLLMMISIKPGWVEPKHILVFHDFLEKAMQYIILPYTSLLIFSIEALYSVSLFFI